MPCSGCSKGSYCPPNAAGFDIERKIIDDDSSKIARFEGFISLSAAIIFTVRKRICANAMFLLMFVCSQGEEGLAS